MSIKNGETPQVNNSAFLAAIFGSKNCWINSTLNMKTWSGRRMSPSDCKLDTGANNYFCISSIKQSSSARSLEDFEALMCVVLDDVSEVGLVPSWKLETSKGNYQLGFILAEPLGDVQVAQKLLNAIADKALINGNDPSGNNPVRYARLPEGTNTKNGVVFQHRLHVWQPDTKYTIDELVTGLGLSFNLLEAKATDPFELMGSGVDLAEAVEKIISQDSYYDPLLKLTGNLVARGTPESVAVELAQAVMHAAGDDSARFKERYALIPGMVKGAVDKFVGKSAFDQAKEFKPFKYNISKLTAPRFVIDGFVTAEMFTVAGEAGVGKSSILVTLCAIAAHICNPDNQLKPKLRRKIVYLTEDPEQVERILFGLYKNWGLSIPELEVEDFFTIIPVHRSKPEVLANLIHTYSNEKMSLQTGKRGPVNVPPLFVFDTAAATFSLANENDNSEVSNCISICKTACLQTRTPLWIIHHLPKANSEKTKGISARGAGAWTGDVNGTIFITKSENPADLVRYMTLGKHRFVPDFDALQFTAHFGEELTQNELGEEVSIPYIYGDFVKSSQEDRTEKANRDKDSRVRASIYSAIKDANEKLVPINRTAVKTLVGGNQQTALRTLQEMISEGYILEYQLEHHLRANNNQRSALKVAKNWDGSEFIMPSDLPIVNGTDGTDRTSSDTRSSGGSSETTAYLPHDIAESLNEGKLNAQTTYH